MIDVIIFATFTAIATNIIMQPGEILHFWSRILNKLPEQAAKPLGECVKCFGGQLAFWGYIFFIPKYDIIQHTITVTTTIILGYLWQNYAK